MQNSSNNFSSDICYEILSFLDSWTILNNCLLISKGWYHCIVNYSNLHLEIKSKFTDKRLITLSESKLLERIVSVSFQEHVAEELTDESENHSKFWQVIGSMTRLTKFDMVEGGGLFSHSPPMQIIANLKNLRELNLKYMDLFNEGAILISQSLKSMTKLNVAFCGIKSEGIQAIGTMKQLTYLSIGTNDLGIGDINTIATLSQLKFLDISCNFRNNNGYDFSPLVKLEYLSELDISKNVLYDNGLIFIREMKQLTSLDAYHISIKSAGVEIISELPNLIHINIGSNNISNSGAKHVSKMRQLTCLNISSCNLTECTFLHGMKQLERLDISSNLILNQGLDIICCELTLLKYLNISEILSKPYLYTSKDPIKLDKIASLDLLTDLVIENDFLDEEGIRYLCGLNNLTSLNISKNSVNSHCLEMIATSMTHLTKLELNNTELTELCLEYIGEMKQLRVLDIQNNELDYEMIVKTITKLPRLAEIYISKRFTSGENTLLEISNSPVKIVIIE